MILTSISNTVLFSKKTIGFIFIFVLAVSSCKKLVEINAPKTQITTTTVFSDDATATSAMRGVYSSLSNVGFANGGLSSVTFYGALSADDFLSFATSQGEASVNLNALTVQNSLLTTDQVWSDIYQKIYQVNSILEGLANSDGVSSALRSQLRGEAFFIRAFCFFYLVNLYGEVPLTTTVDYRINNLLSRSSVDDVYKLILKDLSESKQLLSADYSYSSGEKVRANKWAASALLARTYLYLQNWVDAEKEASEVITNSGCSIDIMPNEVFLANSAEVILQLMPVVPGKNTNEAANLVIPEILENAEFPVRTLRDELINEFSQTDERLLAWVDTVKSKNGSVFYYPYKYKVWQNNQPITEYSVVFRLAEMYLIRSEARAELDDFLGSLNDINAIRNRAGLLDTVYSEKSEAIGAIMHERRIELMTEWGHRWLDIKRRNLADAILQPIKGSEWQSTDVFYPIPQSERNNNPHLSQNPGYQQ